MKIATLTTTAITATILLNPLLWVNSVLAGGCLGNQELLICVGNDGSPIEGTREQRLRQLRLDYYDEINGIYQEVLGRNVDPQGFRTWSRALRRNHRLRDVRRKVARSREGETVINQIYREVLGRNVDPDGLRTYTGQLASGWSIQDVRRDIRESDEARNLRLRGL
ncbi:MAG: DUF4214 domain-containing protein [Coleofasciculaceae cyanobacterium]